MDLADLHGQTQSVITLKMIWRLLTELGIPVESLIGQPVDREIAA